MKINLIVLSLCLSYVFNTYAQDPHIFTRYSSQPEITEEVREEMNKIPYYIPKKVSKSIKSISHIDNSLLKFFPSIFNQLGNSCSQASGIRYIFSYEINRIRDLDASSKLNVYSYHYTWNFLNKGTDMGSWYYHGFDLVKDNGVPSLNEFNDEAGLNEKTWMTGYDKYFKAIHNKIKSKAKINAETSEGLDLIKQYLVDHGDGSKTGGLIVFSGKTANWDMVSYNGPSNTGYKYVIKEFGNGYDHAMTFVGFDDSVKVDMNNDNIIQDSEIGALIMVNSWGSGWGDNGRAYVPYALLSRSWNYGGMGNGDHFVYVIEALDHKPSVVAKVNLKYTSRNDLWMTIGVSEMENAEFPDRTKPIKIIKKQGGDYYMQGTTSETGKKIEIGLDYSDLIDKKPDAKKFFLTVKQSPEGNLGEGIIEQFSIMDYRGSLSPSEYISNQKNVTIDPSTLVTVSTETTTNINDSEVNPGIYLFPNPITGGSTLTVRTEKDLRINKLELIHLDGTLINIDYSQNSNNTNVLIPNNLPTGIYYLRVFETERVFSRKIIVN